MKSKVFFLLSLMLVGLVFMSFRNKSSEGIVYELPQNRFKNLKVLPQNISKDSLMSLMEGYNLALGVKCNYCHIKDKADDSKLEKEITRHMIKMTDEINRKEFAPFGEKYTHAVNCATCHRGNAKAIESTNIFMKKAQEEIEKSEK